MSTFIRLTDYKSSDAKEEGFFKPENRYEAKQEDFVKIPGSPVAYWVSEKIKKIYSDSKSLGNLTTCRAGMTTGNNDKFLRSWFEIENSKFGRQFFNRQQTLKSFEKWFPFNKGSSARNWYGNNELLVNWQNDGIEIRNNIDENGRVRSTVPSQDYYFKKGLTWSTLSNVFSVRYFPEGYLFDTKGSCLFDVENIEYILGLLNTKIVADLLKTITPTLDFNAGYIAKIPVVETSYPEQFKNIQDAVKNCIAISREEWDSRETSWDFRANPLLEMLSVEYSILNEENNSKFKIQNLTLESVYNRYCNYWREKFYKLHANEEELNRLFIDIYELQDELTPDVALGDITILKNEATIEDGKLVFKADEIIKQLISYGVGVLFGRYSLDHDGLHIANMNESIEEANSKFKIQHSTFEADDDNIIPVLDDEYFNDDIVSRFISFVKTTFGEESLSENVKFIEESLGKSLRAYFVKDFYDDHVKRYKKRPIYWMVSSPKKGFMSLIYMHRYTPDIFARVRNSYLTEYIAKLEAHKETLHLTTTSEAASNKDKKDADKAIKNIEAKLKEVIAYDRDVMMHYAQNGIEIDLDDGVKVNYCKFKEILYEFDKKLCE